MSFVSCSKEWCDKCARPSKVMSVELEKPL